MKPSTANRRVRAVAFDPRLAIGLGLVAASVAGVLAIVSAADETVEVYAAGTSLAPGDRIAPGDLEPRHVRLDDVESLYLVPGEVPAAGLVVTRSVAEGELVPVSAIGSVEGLRLTSVVLEVSGALAAAVQPTSLVDIWAAREVEGGGFGPPSAIVSAATVVRLLESDSIVSGGSTTAIEVLVPKAKLARVLEAIANRDAISIVPSNLPGR
jgi:hypothetical protein